MIKQMTLKGSFSLCGKGLHTGLSLTVTFNPAPENTGYKIQRIDLDGMPTIDAIAENEMYENQYSYGRSLDRPRLWDIAYTIKILNDKLKEN